MQCKVVRRADIPLLAQDVELISTVTEGEGGTLIGETEEEKVEEK